MAGLSRGSTGVMTHTPFCQLTAALIPAFRKTSRTASTEADSASSRL